MRSKLVFEKNPRRSTIVALAINPDPEKNSLQNISCKKGAGANHLVYDFTQDAYIVEAESYLVVGSTPYTCELSLKDAIGWKVFVPRPEALLRQLLQPHDVSRLDQWQKGYAGRMIKFLEVIDVY